MNQPAIPDGKDHVNDDIVNNDDAEEGRVHHMFSRILNLRIFFTKFGKSFLL
jgi:hypothetical protein